MDLTRYDQPTRELMEKCTTLTAACDRKALKYINDLKKLAAEMGDNALLGFVYFCYASWYYDSSEYDEFQANLGKAIRHLLKSDAHDLLARAYNFFAYDAQNNDAYDVAYSYYNSALQFVDKKTTPSVYGTSIHNLATFYYEIGDYDNSRQLFREAISLIKKNKSDPFYHRNLIIAYMSECTTSINMDDISGAGMSLEIIEDILETAEDSQPGDIDFTYLLLKIRYSLAIGDRQTAERDMEDLRKLLKDKNVNFIEMTDVSAYCMVLMEYGMMEEVRELVDAVATFVEKAGITHAIKILVGIKVELYDRLGDEENLIESLKEQHGLLMRQRKEQARIYKYSMNLINYINEIREEEAAVRLENQHMQVRIATDPLTGIPNRYAMDRKINQAFEAAVEGRHSLGVEIMDVDEFKAFNDRYGHQAGDSCLEMIGSVLRDICEEEGAFYARYGGDEFVIVYENKDNEEIEKIAGRIGDTVAKSRIEVGGKLIEHKVTISQGICNDVPRMNSKPWDFLTAADSAMYSVKGTEDKRILVRNLPVFG